jgi:hypothetical protein
MTRASYFASNNSPISESVFYSNLLLWLPTAAMSDHLGIHRQTLLKMRRSDLSPFKEGRDYRWNGLTANGKLQWNKENAELAYTGFLREPVSQLETFSRVNASTAKAKRRHSA